MYKIQESSYHRKKRDREDSCEESSSKTQANLVHLFAVNAIEPGENRVVIHPTVENHKLQMQYDSAAD